MKKILAAALILTAAAGAVVLARHRAATPEFHGKAEIIAATFSSAWCASCRILEPRLAKAIPAFAGKPVKFVDFDLTFGERPELKAAADADGIGDVYDRYAKATGFTVLIDADTGEVVDVITAAYSKDAIRAAVALALEAATEV
jgi:thiol-disulfide isomerase/thioredoxin